MKCLLPLDFDFILYYHLNMTHTDERIRAALIREHQQLTHDCFDANEMNDVQYAAFLAPLSRAELLNETGCDASFTLDEFMSTYG